uniref:Kinetochore protein SPC25 n=1 Tax=Tetradesmus obliquus TaxID=3088 RepID=A0A383WD28_TETOB|eukprot:jgi/Sobl393_1/2389/SZX74989.1
MANAINLQELEQELTRTRGMFEHWSAGILTRAQECNASHISKLRAGKGELTALKERYQHAEKQAAQVRQQMAQDTEHEQELQERADALVAEQQLLQKRLMQLQQELDSEADAVQQLAAEVAGKEAEHSHTVSHLEQLHNAYQQCLGLRLISGESELYLEFTQIDPQQPERSFGFAVTVVGDDNRYTVTRCEPEVEGRQQLEAALLRRHDFGGFVRAMRQQFRQIAAAER